jgi:methylated-DNA-[protein]-cysteine S-methyltransferase
VRTHTILPSPVGDLTVVAESGSLVRLSMGGPKGGVDAAGLGRRDDRGLATAVKQLEEYFRGWRTTFELSLAPEGNSFQHRVWELLMQIPYGQTRSYGDLARALGDVTLSQAVGAANGRNPIAIVVPCHRVIGTDGSLVGYAGGLERKRFLLALEESDETRAGRLF